MAVSSGPVTNRIPTIGPDHDGVPTLPPSEPLPQRGDGIPGSSTAHVRNFDGAALVSSTDILSTAFGSEWALRRGWTSKYDSANQMGSGWMQMQIPHLAADLTENMGTVTVHAVAVVTGLEQRRFTGSTLTPHLWVTDKLVHDSGNGVYLLYRPDGHILKFQDFAIPTAPWAGKLLEWKDAAGNITTITPVTGTARIEYVTRQASSSVTERWKYEYTTNGTNSEENGTYADALNHNLVWKVTLEREVGGTWDPVRRAVYAYYTDADRTNDYGGSPGQLKRVWIRDNPVDTGTPDPGDIVDEKYYRYYTSGSQDGLLKHNFDAASFARLKANVSGWETSTSASDSTLRTYADDYFEYDGDDRVTKHIAQGADRGMGQIGTFNYAYATPIGTSAVNQRAYKTTITHDDPGTSDDPHTIVYSDWAGLPMLVARGKHNGSGYDYWADYFKYDTSGRVLWHATPAAVTGSPTNWESHTDLVDLANPSTNYLRDTAGKIDVISWYGSTTATDTAAGGVAGFLNERSIARGESNTSSPIKLEALAYKLRTSSDQFIVLPGSTTRYRNTNGTGSQVTSYSYTFVTGLQVDKETITHPAVATNPSGQNGPGTSDVETKYYDTFGRLIWHQDGDGYILRLKYDDGHGGVTERIEGVDLSQVGDEPMSWGATTVNGPHLRHQMTSDQLGRTTRHEDPKGQVTHTVYLDADDNGPRHEIRTYRGFTDTSSTSGTVVGPIEVQRTYRAGSFVEYLTTSATVSVEDSEPDGGETITTSNLQSLRREYYGNDNRLSKTDLYFATGGLSGNFPWNGADLGTASNDSSTGSRHRTSYTWDAYGRLERIDTPSGTRTKWAYDQLDRPISTSIGTSDTDMTTVEEYQYDGGSVGGNHNLTKVTRKPGGGAADRVTEYYYDWRDRIVAKKIGATAGESSADVVQRPIYYGTYDNLDQVTAVEQFDGDGVVLSDTVTGHGTLNDGVPELHSDDLDQRRAKTVFEYDDRGRTYRTSGYSVNQSSGAVSANAIRTDRWYDRRGNVVKQTRPNGPTTKFQYDGAGRVTKQSIVDASDDRDSVYGDALNVSLNTVLEQRSFTYDAASNITMIETKQRFHNASGDGALATPATEPKARRNFTLQYFDAANRMTAQVDLGTNGGVLDGTGSGADLDADNNGTADVPASVPSRSDLALVTSYGYDAAGRVDTVTDPKNLTDRYTYDLAGRITKVIESATSSPYTPTDSTNRTTEYTYEGRGEVLTMKAVLPSSAFQTTQYVYDATAAGGSDFASKDVLTEVRYPDKTYGTASTSHKETIKRNALGEAKQYTDMAGNVHDYAHDVVGRLTSDYASTVASGFKASIRELVYSYTGAGWLEKATSYGARVSGVPASGTVSNQVQREYNGLGQLTKEYQEHNGAVNTSTSEFVEYLYDEMPSGANYSRLKTIKYPKLGTANPIRVVHYEYNTGTDSNVSRVSNLAYDSGGSPGTHLEEYSYLGLNTVVTRNRPEPNRRLTYVKDTNDTLAGDAGDQYKGLDRFGRVVDQRWVRLDGNGDTASTVEQFKYGYDENGSVLYKLNMLSTANSELYHDNGSSAGYDSLDRLTHFKRGTLNAGNDSITGTASREQTWDLDALGNWDSITTTVNGGTPSQSTRNHNRQNQITDSPITHDAAGNITKAATGTNNSYTYDAWNRMVEYGGGQAASKYEYPFDALHRRIQEDSQDIESPNIVNYRDLYYSDRWQVIAERYYSQDSQENPTTVNQTVTTVWSAGYVDELVQRSRATSTEEWDDFEWQYVTTNTSDTLYVQQDANFNVTSVTDTSGNNVLERYQYDPYGKQTYLTGTWGSRSSSSYGMVYLHQGGRYNLINKLYSFRFRDYSADLGRWMQMDPARYVDGPNVYQGVGSSPVSLVDPTGLWLHILAGAVVGAVVGGILGGWEGAAAGAVGGAVGAATFNPAAGAAAAAGLGTVGAGAVGGAVSGAMGGAAGGVVTEIAEDDGRFDWDDVGESAAVGAIGGLATGGIAGAAGAAGGRDRVVGEIAAGWTLPNVITLGGYLVNEQ